MPSIGNSTESHTKKNQKVNDPNQPSPLQRFEKSMVINYEKWHDGIGYDLEAIEEASEQECVAIEQMLIRHRPRDWRDIEALAKIGTESAREAIKSAIKNSDPEVRIAVTTYAPELVKESDRIQSVTDALEHAEVFSGLSRMLDDVEEFHPPEVKEALIKGLLSREGEVATLFAGMLFYLYGKADEAFDWSQRPFFLRFNTEKREERLQAFKELCIKLNIDPQKYLDQKS